MRSLVKGETGRDHGADLRKRKLFVWGRALVWTILAIYAFVFMEWLFYVTKPSFMSLMPVDAKLSILLTTGLAIVEIALPFLFVLAGISLVSWWSQRWWIFVWIGSLIPAFFLAANILMLVDHFTYTVLKTGIVTTHGIQRGIYGLMFLCILIGCLLWVNHEITSHNWRRRLDFGQKAQIASCSVLLLVSLVITAREYQLDPAPGSIPVTGARVQSPNVLLLGSDALDADHLSLYGYQRDTTPFLKTLAQNSLVSENNFPNANISAGSFASIFTGKLPTTTRVLYPPDILHGDDVYEHFPGILKDEGYFNVALGVDWYADVTQFDLRDGFSMVNGLLVNPNSLYALSRRFFSEDAAYFLSEIASEVSDRLQHITYIRDMPDPYTQVTQELHDLSDREKVDQIIGLFHNVHQSLFVQAYLMGTHLASPDRYDDTIQAFDGYVREITQDLARTGKLDQTVIIIYTDHGYGNTSNVRTPLLIRFPNGDHAGTITHNTQNLDIAPTILDYLGITPPEWMDGQSLLQGEPPATRPIFSAYPNFRVENEERMLQLDLSKIKPPFYQFGIIGMAVCQKWYTVDTTAFTWKVEEIPGYPTPCEANALPSNSQAQHMILEQLQADHFDVSSLKTRLDP